MSYTDQDFETAASHTPGPWRVTGLEQPSDMDRSVYATTKSGNPLPVARVYGEGVIAHFRAERVANARLIAAAPDLLGELRNIVDNAWQYDDDAEEPDGPWTISNETYQRIAALVAKATGK